MGSSNNLLNKYLDELLMFSGSFKINEGMRIWFDEEHPFKNCKKKQGDDWHQFSDGNVIELRDHYVKAWVWEIAVPGVKVINWDNCQESKFVSGVHFIICETQDQAKDGPG